MISRPIRVVLNICKAEHKPTVVSVYGTMKVAKDAAIDSNAATTMPIQV